MLFKINAVEVVDKNGKNWKPKQLKFCKILYGDNAKSVISSCVECF